jgi:uncharacterized protein YggT (Ycf19 family)
LLYPIVASLLRGMVLFLNLYSWLIVIDAAFTLFTKPKDGSTRLKQVLREMTDPINNVSRKLLQKFGATLMPIDISPMLSLIFLWVLSGLFRNLSHRYYELFL